MYLAASAGASPAAPAHHRTKSPRRHGAKDAAAAVPAERPLPQRLLQRGRRGGESVRPALRVSPLICTTRAMSGMMYEPGSTPADSDQMARFLGGDGAIFSIISAPASMEVKQARINHRETQLDRRGLECSDMSEGSVTNTIWGEVVTSPAAPQMKSITRPTNQLGPVCWTRGVGGREWLLTRCPPSLLFSGTQLLSLLSCYVYIQSTHFLPAREDGWTAFFPASPLSLGRFERHSPD